MFKVLGIRSEVFGELTFIDHGEVPINPTPWPNRAEAAIRMFKKQVSLMLISLKDDHCLPISLINSC